VNFAAGGGAFSQPLFLTPSFGNTNGGGGSSLGNSANSVYVPVLTSPLPPVQLPKGTSISYTPTHVSQSALAAQSVPDGGSSLILLGSALLLAFGFGRRKFWRS
jgi:hypothetical protein